jgi:hypothetical protein
VALVRAAAPSSDRLEFEDRGHSLTIDRGWREIADATIAWLPAKGL